jgi:hypothetical protein
VIFVPPIEEMPGAPRRVILHWTAGGHRTSRLERERYHLLLEHVDEEPEFNLIGGTRWKYGVPIRNNMGSAAGRRAAHNAPNDPLAYAAHTGKFNSYSIGVAFCGMRGAVDYRPGRPVAPGPEPLTVTQVDAMVTGLATMLSTYNLEPIPEHLFDHWEAHHVHGVTQRAGVWDCQWMPGEDFRRGEVMDWIRDRVKVETSNRTMVEVRTPRPLTPGDELQEAPKPPEPPRVVFTMPGWLYRPARSIMNWGKSRK